MINNFTKNCMGTISFDAKFKGMRKPQSFIVYPMKAEETKIKIQSDKKIGTIDITSGDVSLADDKYNIYIAKHVQTLTAEELLLVKLNIFASASGKAGTCWSANDTSQRDLGGAEWSGSHIDIVQWAR